MPCHDIHFLLHMVFQRQTFSSDLNIGIYSIDITGNLSHLSGYSGRNVADCSVGDVMCIKDSVANQQ